MIARTLSPLHYEPVTADPLKLLGKYQLTDVIGEGAMGVVYRAFDPVLNRYLAIKVMSSMIAHDAQLRERFLREARAAGSLQHPNVITIYDFGEVGEHLFIAMEYVEGVDLAEIIQRRDNIPVTTKLDIMVDALNGLAYAHGRGVVHRDIKPANIRVSVDTRAKLLDFGIAHLQSSEMTRSGEMLGTPQYMAPEQVSGGAVTPATDIFAMGSVMYEFLTYTKAFTGDTLHIILFHIASAEPPPLRQVLPELPAVLDPILAKALAKDPAARYTNALAMAKDLAIARASLSGAGELGSVTVRASQIRRIGSVKSARSAPWRLVAGAGALASAALAMWWFGPWRTTRPSPTPSGVPVPVQAAPPQALAAKPPESATRLAPSRSSGVERPVPPSRQSAGRVETAAVDSVVRSLRGAAISARRRAQDAGVSAQELATGDSLLAAAEILIAQHRGAEAVIPLSSAGERWSAAERGVPDRATAMAERARVTAPPALPPAPPASSPAAPRESVAAPPTDYRPEIERVLATYARAIESGSIADIRRVYPALTAQQQQRWEDFFRSVRNLRARLSLDQLAVHGNAADAVLSAIYDYENKTNGRSARDSSRLQASLSRESAGWRFTFIR